MSFFISSLFLSLFSISPFRAALSIFESFQVVAKRYSTKKPSTNFLVTHIKSISDLRRLLTDDSTYADSNAAPTDAAEEDDAVEAGSDAADAESNTARNVAEDDGETIEIEEEVDDDDDVNIDADDASRERESSDSGRKRNSVERKVAKKSTTRASTTAKLTPIPASSNKRNHNGIFFRTEFL